MNIQSFIKSVVGDKSAEYLSKIYSQEVVSHYILLAWISNIGKEEFNKPIPGIKNSNLKLFKIENKYEGEVSIEETSIKFKDKSILDVVAIIAICLDLDNNDLNLNELHKIKTNELFKLTNSFILGNNKIINTKIYKLVINKPIHEMKCDTCGLKLISKGKFNGCACFSKVGVSFKNKINNLIIELDKKTWDKTTMELLAKMLKAQK
jgi:hypothetical protein